MGSGRSALQSSTTLLSLDGGETAELVLGHGDLGSTLETHTTGGTGEERGSVRVEGLVSGCGTLEFVSVFVDKSWGGLSGLSSLKSGDDGTLEQEFDQVEGEVPDNVPDPDDTDPSTGDGFNISETPVGETGNDGGNQLSETEGKHQSDGWSLSPGWTVGTGDEDQSLGDDSDLEVDDHVETVIVNVLVCGDAKLALEEVGVVDNNEEDDSGQHEVETVTDTVGENLCQVPRIGSGGWQDTVEGESHDCTVVEDSDDKNHERREVELPDKGHDGEADNDTDGNGTSVDGVVPHSLENDTGTVDGVNNG